MKQSWIQMGMPIVVEIADSRVTIDDFSSIADYFQAVDERFSTYKSTSEISAINDGKIAENVYSSEMLEILFLANQTKKETQGYFDIFSNGICDPSGMVKGWAIYNAANLLKKRGFKNFYIDAGGDAQVEGHKANGTKWMVGIQNPYKKNENVKVLILSNCGIATSGIAARGAHIYNPLTGESPVNTTSSLTVIGPSVYEADRFATAAFAMGKEGIYFIESLPGFEGYLIDKKGTATYTSHFTDYVFK